MRYCEKCGNLNEVTDSRERDDGLIRRRRTCKVCKDKISTIEIPLKEYQRMRRISSDMAETIEKIRRCL